MSWNEQGGDKDPWGGRRGDQAPPDIDEALKRLKEKVTAFTGKKGSGKGSGSGPGGGIGSVKNLLPIFFTGLFVLYGLAGVYQVDEKEQAVILRLGVYHNTVGSGLHWNPPLIDSVTVLGVTEERQYSTRGLMLTQDENIVEVALSVQYNIANAEDFILRLKTPETTLQQATDSALRHVVGSTGLDGVISTQREQIAIATADRLQALLDIYSSGINVVKINIEDARPPNEVKAAYDDVIEAREDLERLVNEAQAYSNGIIPEARGEAQRLREEAEGYSSQVVSKSEGEANRFVALLEEYEKAPQVTRERLYIDAIEKVMTDSTKILLDTEGGNNMLYLPLDKLGQVSSGSSSQRNNETSNEMIDRVANEVIEKLQRRGNQVQSERRR